MSEGGARAVECVVCGRVGGARLFCQGKAILKYITRHYIEHKKNTNVPTIPAWRSR